VSNIAQNVNCKEAFTQSPLFQKYDVMLSLIIRVMLSDVKPVNL